MGMNYYLQSHPCPTCKHSGVRLHIGKSSVGWPFTFQSHRKMQAYNQPSRPSINSYEDIEHYVLDLNYIITNEDHDMIKLQEFKKLVDEHQQECMFDDKNNDYYTDRFGYLWCTMEFS